MINEYKHKLILNRSRNAESLKTSTTRHTLQVTESVEDCRVILVLVDLFLAHLSWTEVQVSYSDRPLSDVFDVVLVVITFHIFFFSRATEKLPTKLSTKQPWVKGIQLYSN